MAEQDFIADEATLEELEERLERNERAKRFLERSMRGLDPDSHHFPKVREIVIRDAHFLLIGP